jgi:hypothetical protein
VWHRPLQIERLGAKDEAARLRDFFPSRGRDRAVHRLRAGGLWLIHSRVYEDAGLRRRVMDQYRLDRAGLTPLDQTHFEIGDDVFVEAARYRVRGGPNLHPTPARLPGRMAVGDAVAPMVGVDAVVTVAWHGRARLRGGGRAHERTVICLVASQGAARRVQWLAAGVGEIALGAADAPLDRWLIAWTGADGSLFGGAPARLRAMRLPALPLSGDPGRPAAGLIE